MSVPISRCASVPKRWTACGANLARRRAHAELSVRELRALHSKRMSIGDIAWLEEYALHRMPARSVRVSKLGNAGGAGFAATQPARIKAAPRANRGSGEGNCEIQRRKSPISIRKFGANSTAEVGGSNHGSDRARRAPFQQWHVEAEPDRRGLQSLEPASFGDDREQRSELAWHRIMRSLVGFDCFSAICSPLIPNLQKCCADEPPLTYQKLKINEVKSLAFAKLALRESKRLPHRHGAQQIDTYARDRHWNGAWRLVCDLREQRGRCAAVTIFTAPRTRRAVTRNVAVRINLVKNRLWAAAPAHLRHQIPPQS